jgi:hypothetical protein
VVLVSRAAALRIPASEVARAQRRRLMALAVLAAALLGAAAGLLDATDLL